MDFVTFLIVNVILFIRPSELAPELEKVPIYYFAMLACLAFSIVPLMNLVFTEGLVKHPTVRFTLMMLVVAAVALVVNVPDKAFDEELEYLKVITYFILFLAIVRTPRRLQGVIACVVVCMSFTAILGILHFYDIVNIPNLKQLEEGIGNRNDAGELAAVRRLRFTGILDGPNEVAVFLSALTFLCSYQLTDLKQGTSRFVWILPIGLFLTSIVLTGSRSGLLALMAGIFVFAIYFAGRKLVPGRGGKAPVMQAVILSVLAVPALLLAAGGRQSEMSLGTNTARTRFEEWDEWLLEFRHNPIFGVGPQILPRARMKSDGTAFGVAEEGEKLLAHNSYLQPFADLGFLGGVAFLGMVSFGFITLHRYGMGKTMILNPDLARLQPYLIAALTCLAVGFFLLPLNYLLPVYFVLAIPVAYYGMTPCMPPIKRPELSATAFAWLVVGAVGFLAMMYVIVQVMKRI